MSGWLGADILGPVGTRNSTKQSAWTTSEEELEVIRVESLTELIKLIGYLKYTYNGAVFLRGQRRLHGSTVVASRFRHAKSPGERHSRARSIEKLIRANSSWSCNHAGHAALDCDEIVRAKSGWLPRGAPRYVVEGLLQHYGLSTRWIDAVDNLWVALWFACHRFVRGDSYAHIVRESLTRSVPQLKIDEDGAPFFDPSESFVYVLCLLVKGEGSEIQRGLIKHEDARIIDLRRAAPSFFTRPHAQHGLVLRPTDDDSSRIDYCAFEVSLHDALLWLGDGIAVSPYAMFPPASDDDGYRQLLDRKRLAKQIEVQKDLLNYGPGY
jgi:hypothetical protein